MSEIKISNELLDELNSRKLGDDDSYEDVIWDLLESTMGLSEETKKDIAKAEEDIKKDRVYTLDEVKKELGITSSDTR